MFKTRSVILTALVAFSILPKAHAAMVPDYAKNNYQNHELSRSEKKCIDEGYKITYANCSNQTAPADPCPHHEAYYRSCSQEQWCRNNNYTLKKDDCKRPQFATKLCDNNFPLYRGCKENIEQACSEAGFTSKDKCQLSEVKCPYSPNFGKCCGNCEDYPYSIIDIPAGYVQDGTPCKTCSGQTKVKITEADCEGFQICEFGPLSEKTAACQSGEQILFLECQTAQAVCQNKGFEPVSCSETEDTENCPEDAQFVKCHTNCTKLAAATYPEADIITEDVTNPILDLQKTQIRSMVGLSHPDCANSKRPVVTLNLDEQSAHQYINIFDRDIKDIDFVINYINSPSLIFNGTLNNSQVMFQGNIPDCPFIGDNSKFAGKVSIKNAEKLCSNITTATASTFTTSGSVESHVITGESSTFGIQGNFTGALQTGKGSNLFIKGTLTYEDPANNSEDSESIVFGCNSRNKVMEGIIANTSSIVIKSGAKLDTPKITLISTSNSLNLPNYLASVHINKGAYLFSSYGNKEDSSIFEIMNNDGKDGCDDKYYTHLGSSIEEHLKSINLEPSNRKQEAWKCRKLNSSQLKCN